MKSAKTLLLAFSATLLLLLAHAWSAEVLAQVWIAGVCLLVVGSWVSLVVSVSGELYRDRRWQLSQLLFPAIVLTVVGLTWWFNIFPYAWNALVTVLLAGCVAWRGFRDYAELFRRRTKAVGPADWHSLEQARLPASSAGARRHAKEHFARSYDVNVTCTPRCGALGLASHPLRMDE
jgi:hypothetical protein